MDRPIHPPKPHLPGPAATRKWWEAVERGDVGVLEREVSRMRDQHSRMLLHLHHPRFTGGAIHRFPAHITLQQAISDLVNMQQPWVLIEGNDDPYLDQYDGGSSALSMATGKGHTEIVSYLLSLGCVDLGLIDAQGMNVLHHACIQGNADILKMLLLSCPNRSIQLKLLQARDKRAMDCKKMVAVGRSDWQSAGVTAHSSGSFLRRKAYQKLLLPTIKWWKNRNHRRSVRRRLGQGIHGDNAGSRDFDTARDLVVSPPAPAHSSKSQGIISKTSLKTLLLLASRRTRSPLSTLNNEIIWLTALEYDEGEELELGSAIAHSPALKTAMESVTTVMKAQQALVMLRFILNMRKGRKGGEGENKVSLLLEKRSGCAQDEQGQRLSWFSVDEKKRQQQETASMADEDRNSEKYRPYLTVDTLKLCQLQRLYLKLAGEKVDDMSSMSHMSGLKFARFAALVGQYANEEHVASILTSIPSWLRTEDHVGDCSLINFVQFWLHSETLERRKTAAAMHAGDIDYPVSTIDQMVNKLNAHDEQQIDWFTRLRVRMRINRALSMPQNGDPTICRGRSVVLMNISMGVGIVPQYHPSIVSHRKQRSSLVKFTPAKEFTQEEVVRQRRARNAKVSQSNQGTGAAGAALVIGKETNKDEIAAAPPEVPSHLQREGQKKPKSFAQEEDMDLNENEKAAKAEQNKKSKQEEAAAKRRDDAKMAAINAKKRQDEMKKRLLEKKKLAEEEAQKQAALFELEQKKERTRLKKIEKKKKREEKKKQRERKRVEKEAKRATKKLKTRSKKSKSKSNRHGRRRVDNGSGQDVRDQQKVETLEERNKSLEELNRGAKKARKIGYKSAAKQHKTSVAAKKRWGLLKSVTSSNNAVTNVMWNVRARTAAELVDFKNDMKKKRRKARKRALASLDGGEEWNIYGDNSSDDDDEKDDRTSASSSSSSKNKKSRVLKAPQDDASVLARKLERQKKFNAHEILGIDHEQEGWCVADSFVHSGYAHRTNLKLIKLKPLQFFT